MGLPLDRRQFLRVVAIGGAAALSACAPATPAPTAAPAQPTAAPKPTAASAPAATSAPAPTNVPAAPTSALAATAPVATKPAAIAASVGSLAAAWVQINGSMVPAWIASDLGLYDKHGLKVDLTFIQGSPNATAAMLAGNLQAIQMAGVAAINAVQKGADMAMIAGFVNTAVFKLMADPSIKSVADLKGKGVAISNPGGADDFILRKVLKDNGLAQGDVTFLDSKDANGQLAAYQAKQCQAIMLTPPDNTRAEKVGAVQLLDTATLKIPYQSAGVATTRANIRDRRPALLAFLKAESEAIHLFKTNRPQAESILQKYLKTDDPTVVKTSYDTYAAVFADVPYPSEAGIQEILDELGDTSHKPSDFADPSLVKELEDGGFFKSLGVP